MIGHQTKLVGSKNYTERVSVVLSGFRTCGDGIGHVSDIGQQYPPAHPPAQIYPPAPLLASTITSTSTYIGHGRIAQDLCGHLIAEIDCYDTKKAPPEKCWDKDVAERVGFEPTDSFSYQTISSRSLSTTQPPLPTENLKQYYISPNIIRINKLLFIG